MEMTKDEQLEELWQLVRELQERVAYLESLVVPLQ